MNIDAALVELVNAPVGASATFDKVVFLITELDLLKAAVGVAVLLGAVRQVRGELLGEQLVVLRALLATTAAVFGVRLSQEVLPFRMRPVVDPALDVTATSAFYDTSLAALETSSSFPSDHAAIMGALTAATWLVSRRAGVGLGIWSVVVVLLPRVYLGLHFVSDIVVGAVAGGAIAVALIRAPLPAWSQRARGWMQRHPGVTTAVLFIAFYEIAVLFIDIRFGMDSFGF